MEKTKRAWFVRFLGEALAIFAGVALALAADDWRQTRSEAYEADVGLALVVEDVRGDSAVFANLESIMARHAAAAAWLIEQWDRDHEVPDSVEAALEQFGAGGIARFNRAAFEGLRDSNRLRLIKSDSMRTAITRYYQGTQVSISDYYDLAYLATIDLADALAPNVRPLAGRDPGSLLPASDPSVQLRYPWGQVAADPILHYRVHRYGVLSAFLATRFGAGQEVAGALIRHLESG